MWSAQRLKPSPRSSAALRAFIQIRRTKLWRYRPKHPLNWPIRESGDLANTPGIVLEGPAGTTTIPRGVICAQRHIHMSPDDAMRFRLRDKYVVQVRVEGARELIYGDVVVRVNPNYRLAMHIDTDEGNAANIKTGMLGYIEEIQSRG
jgi:acetate kinase